MEFRYRANDGDRLPPATDSTTPSQSLNPNSSFFSVSPLPGEESEDHVREAIKREIEKEQIRQEIIAAETARRRELIAEVVQEMAIEREMAIRRVAETKGKSLTQNKNNGLFRQKCSYTGATTSPMMHLLPLQQMPEATETSIMEPVKEKLIVLERADSEGEDTDETGLERGKRKADGDEKEPFGTKRLKSTREFKFWCDVCSVGTYSETVMRSHNVGKKHMAAIEKQKELPEITSAASSSLITAPASVTVLENANVEDQKVDAMALKETGMKTVMMIRCETCDIVTNSEKMMKIHKLGKKHKAQLKKQCPEEVMVEAQQNRKPLDVSDTNII
ncbi:unnamed protein product [Microthlaspi erraticum]|uniref:U1-type domain-containing protein n=1 Tax=Microthlaspi erraticum TaxID=1685480 RepID=A0A6D2JPB7_9BRAS|nr:unnamed protein product [Microthlaspi erraticum]